MAFSNFRVNVALRLAAFAIGTFVALWGWNVAHWQVTPLVAALVAIGSLVELVRYIERTHRELTGFLRSVAHQDYSVPVPESHKGYVFDELEEAYRTLNAEFRRLNLQKAANHEYLEAVVQHVGVALIGIDETGRIVLANTHALNLFGVPHLAGLSTLARVDSRLPVVLRGLRDGDRELFSLRRGEEELQLVLYATAFTLVDRRHMLVSLQNIRDELERRETESWQKLVRVLTHEIMNSVTPIISLSRLAQEMLASDSGSENRGDLMRSVSAVHARSSGLLEFVQAYRSFASVPAPVLGEVRIPELLEQVRVVMQPQLDERGIDMQLQCADRLPTLQADARQLEQVLINLVRNAMEALQETPTPRIILRAADEHGRVLIQVIDNGAGIDPAHLESIFVPFFTTRRGGTGVGLSISRQLVQANRGSISARAGEVRGSVLTLSFASAPKLSP